MIPEISGSIFNFSMSKIVRSFNILLTFVDEIVLICSSHCQRSFLTNLRKVCYPSMVFLFEWPHIHVMRCKSCTVLLVWVFQVCVIISFDNIFPNSWLKLSNHPFVVHLQGVRYNSSLWVTLKSRDAWLLWLILSLLSSICMTELSVVETFVLCLIIDFYLLCHSED